MMTSKFLESAEVFIQQLAPKSKIFVTGATGLIGYNLVNILLDVVDLCCRDDIIIYANTRRPEKNLWRNHRSLKTVNWDLFSLEAKIKFDAIFHLATYGQPGRFQDRPLETMKLNSQALFNLETVLDEDGIFYFASSSEVYSGNPNIPHKEDECGFTNTNHPRSMYIEAKRFAEAYCYWKAEAGCRYYVGRISLSYGPGATLQDERVLNQLIIRGINDGEIRLLDDGSAVRQYCYIDDTLDIIFRQINGYFSGPMNICGTTIISILDLGKEIAAQLKVPLYVGNSFGSVTGAPQIVSSSLDLVKSSGKNEFVPLAIGIQKTIAWYKELVSGV